MARISLVKDSDQFRKSELARIHVLKAKLGLDEESYRDVLWGVGRVSSAADLDWAGRKAVIRHLVKIERMQGSKADQEAKALVEGDSQLRKCRALWITLRKLGAVKDGSERAMLAWAVSRTGLSHARFLVEADKLNSCIEGMKRWIQEVHDGRKTRPEKAHE